MKAENFDVLVERVEHLIRRSDTYCRFSITPAERLMVTLRFLATGEFLSSLHFQFRLGISTISGVVMYTCRALWDSLHDDFIPHPTMQTWLEVADRFQEVCQFPNCFGMVDGKHIRILKPAGSGSEYFNYKKYFSVVLMAITDADYKFVAMDIGAYGRSNDSQVFKRLLWGGICMDKPFNSPPRPLPQTSEPPMPFVCVGDEAFQLSEHRLKPYSSRGLNNTKRIFNYRVTRARRMVECAFGILTAKWRVLLTSINLKTDTVDEVVKACVVLHNYVLSKEQISIEDQSEQTSLADCSNQTN
ncbi:uncharacterized protein [Ranitomeya imitator]|uniref:uncharacterized protein n=1 Tax=Ranitomeya imitator TaxID=111125 RepID=UPI0037E7BDA5